MKELDAELCKVRAAPWPKDLAKEIARALLTGLAEASAPNVLGALTHNQHVTFPTARVTSQVYNVDTAPAAVAFAEIVDTLGLVAWAFRDELTAKVCTAIDAAATNEKAALDEAQREERVASIMLSHLQVERREAACISAAEARGEIIDWRGDMAPQSVHGVHLITKPLAPTGTSPEHVIEYAGMPQ